MIIRTIRETDADTFLSLCKKLDEETEFMLFEPGERNIAIPKQQELITEVLVQRNATIFVVDHEDVLIGYIGAYGGTTQKTRHCAYIVLGILKEFSGRGIGTLALEEIEKWARAKKLKRLELSVMTHNTRAIGLYKKMGFSIEGKKRKSLLVGGRYIDEYEMGKLLQ